MDRRQRQAAPVSSSALAVALRSFEAASAQEAADVARVLRHIEAPDLWLRDSPLHVTGSALVVHPQSRRVLLRWHARLEWWAQVGGHADPGERDPWDVALREAMEETGLEDLHPWPAACGKTPIQVVIVPVPAHGREPAHEHADVRYLFATATPERALDESAATPLEWMSVAEAVVRVQEANLVELLRRANALLAG